MVDSEFSDFRDELSSLPWTPSSPLIRKKSYGNLLRSGLPRHRSPVCRITDEVLFGDVWKRQELASRDRSLVTVAVLVAMNRVEQLPFHLRLARQNGVSSDELAELVTHLAFYAGWPVAASALNLLRGVGK
ncbi:carboxymuconolactone decarboxylase family protein [Luteibacter anthropi]|uniref:Carboxymuconolactone decarboxylase family protein n=2 Tax=Luteibacter anthropi TaxID=564369 RepID=A0A7X5UD85_9GAMM|nr:carboxymuconolactone decarboxylase family protein [Luteibacter anthropi]